jgi:hypothetical protein
MLNKFEQWLKNNEETSFIVQLTMILASSFLLVENVKF